MTDVYISLRKAILVDMRERLFSKKEKKADFSRKLTFSQRKNAGRRKKKKPIYAAQAGGLSRNVILWYVQPADIVNNVVIYKVHT